MNLNIENYERYQRVVAYAQKIAETMEDAVVMCTDIEQGMREGVAYVVLPRPNMTISKSATHYIHQASFAADSTMFSADPHRIRFVVKDVFLDFKENKLL